MSSAQEKNPWPYAQGLQNCPETRDPVTLRVQGKIPEWLEGVLYRTGPGTFKIPSKKNPEIVFSFDHWFDGLGQDAKSFKEIARAEMELGKVVPYGFHGLWNDLY
ncbi:20651_t:CDS:2 [Racocetra persica]|uniref:20651_t:CDS:1 n=1 Tax=Racocetra persica TaxID=160502 RepID=A0ACA9MSJ3_9GLOM|nr:20651_t:CDS:2 [Racocetra persica]